MVIKAYGELTLAQVNDGENGIPGANGYAHFAYATGANGEGFSKSWFAGATYIGTYSDHTEADSGDYTKYKWNKIKGDKGEQGEKGDSPVFVSVGNDSQNIPCDSSGKTLTQTVITIPFGGYKGTDRCECTPDPSYANNLATYGITDGGCSKSDTTADGWIKLNVPSGSTLGGANTGVVNIKFNVNSEKTLNKVFTWSKTNNGTNGKDAVIYDISPSVTVIKKGEDNVLSPTSVTFKATKTTGNGTPVDYTGRLIISEFSSGTSDWVVKYTSGVSGDSSYTYSNISSTARLIKCELYALGTSTLLDSQTVTIITDIDNVDATLKKVTTTVSDVKKDVDKNAATITDTITRLNTVKYVDEQGNDQTASFEEVLTKHEQTADSIKTTISGNKSEYDDYVKNNDEAKTAITKKVSSLEQNLDGFTQTVKKDYAKQADLDNAKKEISKVTQTADKINWIVSDGTNKSDMTMTSEAINLISNKIIIEGNTIIRSVGTDSNGTTTINELVSKDGSLQSSINQNGEQISSLRHDTDGLTGLFKRVGMGVDAGNNYKQVESTTKVTVNGDGFTVTGNEGTDDQINTTIMNGVYGTNKAGQDIFHLDQEGCHTGRVYMDRGYEVGMEKTNGDIAGMKMVPQLLTDNKGKQVACMCFVVPGGNS